MRLIRVTRAQSTAEYAVLFAIVIGAAIAMQQYVGGRLRGAVKERADNYTTQAKAKAVTAGDVKRTTNSASYVNLNMNNVRKGNVRINSNSNSRVNLQ